MTQEISLDTKQLRTAAREFRTQIPKEIRTEMARKLRTVGRTVATAAIAAARFHIDPGVVKVRTHGPRVTIRVEKTEPKPHHGEALAFENAGKGGSFRHPVFGHRDRWVSSSARPWLTPTAEAGFVWAYREIDRAVEEAFRAAGFH